MSCNGQTEWQMRAFEDLLKAPLRNGIYKKKEFHGRGAKIVNMGELFAYPRMSASVEMKRVELTEKELQRSTLESRDLVFARRSLTAEGAGKCSIVLAVEEPTTFESSIIRARLDQDIADPEFYFYVFNSPLGKYLLGTILRQVAVAGITGGDLAKLEVPVPPIETQEKIASILRMIDNKIELNHQLNQTLEQMAQAIFKSWFVDFEPVKAKIAALDAGGTDEDALLAAMQVISGKDADQLAQMQAEQPEQYAELRATAELFPSAMQDSELGEIPEGWMAPKFDELVTAKQGKYLAKDKMAESQSDDNPIPVWGGNGILGYTKEASYQNPIVLMTCRGSNCGLIRHTASGAWVSNNSFGCIPKMGSTWFLLNYFQASSFDDCVSGSAQPQITYSALKSKHLSYAVDPAVCRRYSDLIAPLYKQLLQNMEENSVLERLRDTLLPKLLSGELSIHQVMEDAKNE